MSNAKAYKFRHNDLSDLEQKCQTERSRSPRETEIYIVTESVFSVDVTNHRWAQPMLNEPIRTEDSSQTKQKPKQAPWATSLPGILFSQVYERLCAASSVGREHAWTIQNATKDWKNVKRACVFAKKLGKAGKYDLTGVWKVGLLRLNF